MVLPGLIAIFSLPLISAANSFKFPTQMPFFSSTPSSNNATRRIAIIGAGAGGSSTAFWLSRAADRHPDLVNIEVDVYDKELYIGGRSTVVHPHDSKSYEPAELGASIFVEANRNLFRAVDEFNLSLKAFGEEDGELGIWDGTSFKFRITQKDGSYSWWDMVRLLFRYGFNTPKNAQALVSTMINEYLHLYKPEFPTWSTIPELASHLNFTDLLTQNIKTYMLAKGVGELYINEFVEAFTRVNYSHNTTDIHALTGLVSQATDNAGGVKGGNYQIFEQFLSRSSAKVHLNTTVASLTRNNDLWTLTTADGESRVYDFVILAAPYHLSGINVNPPLNDIPEQPYVHLHVTLLTTGISSPRPEFFSLDADSSSPSSILTTNAYAEETGTSPQFTSLSYLNRLKGQDGRPDEYLVKIFSLQPVPFGMLRQAFGKFSWVYRKEWDSYPVVPPNLKFAPVQPAPGLFYVNSFEPFISTMETETVSSLNAVRLLLQGLYGPSVVACPTDGPGETPAMKGWDC